MHADMGCGDPHTFPAASAIWWWTTTRKEKEET